MEKSGWEGGYGKRTRRQQKEKHKYLILCCILTLFFFVYPQGDQQAKNSFNLSWPRVQMFYHRFNNLVGLLNGDLYTKIRWGIFSNDLMDRECNCSLPFKVNRKCFYEGKCRSRYIIYQQKKTEISTCVLHTHVIFLCISTGWSTD